MTIDRVSPAGPRVEKRPTPAAERRFWSGMAVTILATALIGFARSYFLRPVVPPPADFDHPLTPLIHLHAALFTAWVLLLVAQTRLIAARRVDLHRRLGLAGVAVAVLMVVVGTLTALQGVVRGVAPGGAEPRRFLVLPLFALVVFAILLAAAVRARRDPQSHKRLMILASIALLPPALARWVLVYLGLGPPAVLALSVLFVVPLVVWDLTRWHRLHRATLWGGLFVALSMPLRIAIGSTDAWLAFADWAVGLVR